MKSRRFGYDGKGQRVVETTEPLGADELAEAIVPFDRELSIVAVRGSDGSTAFYPLTENEHRDGNPRRLAGSGTGCAAGELPSSIATKLLDELDYVGVLAVELFDVGGELLANEFAPRVHNTGHWTIDGAETSQFENHLRAILGLPARLDEPPGVTRSWSTSSARSRRSSGSSPCRARTFTSTARSLGPDESWATSRSSTRTRRPSPRSSRSLAMPG